MLVKSTTLHLLIGRLYVMEQPLGLHRADHAYTRVCEDSQAYRETTQRVAVAPFSGQADRHGDVKLRSTTRCETEVADLHEGRVL